MLAHSPETWAHRASGIVFRMLDRVVPRLRQVGRRNLALAMPELSSERHERILDGVFRSLARALVCFARFPQMDGGNISRWIRYEGLEHFHEAKKRGKGVLFYTAHLGNWELSAFAHGLMTESMHVVVRQLDNPMLDTLASRYRRLSGNRTIDKKDYLRGILKALSRNEAVGILADQNVGLDEGVFVDFFGLKACAHPGFAKIAEHSGAAVIPGYALWSEVEQRYILRFYPIVTLGEDPAADTQLLHRLLEAVIREHPDQWLWIHRRWKTRPPGELSAVSY